MGHLYTGLPIPQSQSSYDDAPSCLRLHSTYIIASTKIINACSARNSSQKTGVHSAPNTRSPFHPAPSLQRGTKNRLTQLHKEKSAGTSNASQFPDPPRPPSSSIKKLKISKSPSPTPPPPGFINPFTFPFPFPTPLPPIGV